MAQKGAVIFQRIIFAACFCCEKGRKKSVFAKRLFPKFEIDFKRICVLKISFSIFPGM